MEYPFVKAVSPHYFKLFFQIIMFNSGIPDKNYINNDSAEKKKKTRELQQANCTKKKNILGSVPLCSQTT